MGAARAAADKLLGPEVVEITDAAIVAPGRARLFTTLEGENPAGSLKDRLVVGELTELLAAGVLRQGDLVSEVSAGSTARSLAHYCRQLGLRCKVFVPVTMPDHEVAWLRTQGASVQQVTREDAYPAYERFCAENPHHRLNQLLDPHKSRHYAALGAAVASRAGGIDVVVGAVGTGHSLLGSADGIVPRPLVISAEPDRTEVIPGVRNVALERLGPSDPCTPDQFDRRVVVPYDDMLPVGEIATTAGVMAIGHSFRLVLTAAARLGAVQGFERAFLLGAENRLLS